MMSEVDLANEVGRSLSWLRRNECAWCGRQAINALRYGCGSTPAKCEPLKRDYRPAGWRKRVDNLGKLP